MLCYWSFCNLLMHTLVAILCIFIMLHIQGATLIISNTVKKNSRLSLKSWSLVHHCLDSYFLIGLIIIETVGCVLYKVHFIYVLFPEQVECLDFFWLLEYPMTQTGFPFLLALLLLLIHSHICLIFLSLNPCSCSITPFLIFTPQFSTWLLLNL